MAPKKPKQAKQPITKKNKSTKTPSQRAQNNLKKDKETTATKPRFDNSQRNQKQARKAEAVHPALKNYKPNEYLYGIHAVETALKNDHRDCQMLIISSAKYDEYKHYTSLFSIDIVQATAEEITYLLPQGAVHQGIALIASPLPIYNDVPDTTKDQDIIMMLDGVTDPHNIGAVLRVCAAFGCGSLIVHDQSSPKITGALAKTAAGATEYVDIIRATNLARSIRDLKKEGYIVYGADGHSDISLPEVKFAKKSLIIMGSEGDGMRRLVKEECDFITSIPMNAQMESLNVSVASGIILGQAYFQSLILAE